MTREQAEQRAAELNRKHPSRASDHWFVREAEDGWEVARVSFPAGLRLDPLKASVESRPKPSPAPDPRRGIDPNIAGL